MDRFVSHITNRLDAKGRVSLPAAFRSLVARGGFEGVYVHPAIEVPALDCGGQALLNEIDGLMQGFHAFSEESETFAMGLWGASQTVKYDGEGRFVVTDMMREVAGITDQVTFVGLGHKFQMWEPSKFEANYTAARERLRAYRKQLGHQSVKPVDGGSAQ